LLLLLLKDKVSKVLDVALLAWNGDSLAVLGPSNPVVLHGGVGGGEPAAEDHVAADHHPGSPLAGLAVHCHNVFGISSQVPVNILAEGKNHGEGRGVVVVKGIPKRRRQKKKTKKKKKKNNGNVCEIH